MPQLTTDFETILNKFYDRIEKDENFFEYYNVDIKEAKAIAETRANITKLQQDSSSFKQEVEKTYMTKNGLNSLKIGGRNLLRNSNTLEFEDYYFVGGTTSYVVDSDGNYVVDEENNMIITI